MEHLVIRTTCIGYGRVVKTKRPEISIEGDFTT